MKVPENDEKGSGGEGCKAVEHGKRQGRKEQGNCVVQSLGREVSGMQQKRRSRSGKQRRNIGSGSENGNEAARDEREGEEEHVRCEVFHSQEESCFFSEELREDWCEDAVEDGPGPCAGRWQSHLQRG